ncbi:unnamed protein product [Oncorhynchus mykiss]|uniref:Gamma-soluble NSF attachment protein n=1 Tax=Oncorhynchus mykiss TaxID=8022 RepID=A0A060YGR4_ONCMY|nr:unnamed protein product [Oncorhynchus mykiss]
MASKINEAHEHIAKAEKNLKTSMTKWKPDFDSAASEYAKAAVCFKNAKQFEQAKDAYLKEAEYHTENKALFHAAKAIEQAGMMMKVSFPQCPCYICVIPQIEPCEIWERTSFYFIYYTLCTM